LLAKTVSALFWIVPHRLRWCFGVFLGWIWFDVLKLRRFTILRNLTIVFPKMPKAEKYRLARLSTYHLCYHFFEFMLLPWMTPKWVKDNVVIEGIEHYNSALAKNKGVLLLSLHVGNGDMGVAVMALAGIKAALISKKLKNKTLNNFWFGIRETSGAEFIDPHGSRTAFEILAKLRKHEAVIFVIDQFMGRPYGIENTFFGRKTGTAYGLALFAVKTGAPVVPVYTYRDRDLKTHLVFEPEVEHEKSDYKDLQIKIMTKK
jgi:KDO2-lipid IV(A) lauroyltransferase